MTRKSKYQLRLTEQEAKKLSDLADRLLSAFGLTDFNSETYKAAQVLRDRLDVAVEERLMEEDMAMLDEMEQEAGKCSHR